MSTTLNWGIIGTGAIAGDFAHALRDSSKCRVVNVVGSSPQKSHAFADKFGIPNAADSIDALLADNAVRAAYIATPHPMHEAHALACIEAGKAALCEKPIALDAAGAERVINAAQAKGTFLMEAYMYRCHPLLKEVIDKLKSGVIGKIRHVRTDFCFYVERDPKHRLFNPDLAGGGILDVGGYPASFTRLIAGIAADKPFDEPSETHAVGHIGPTGVDELSTAQLRFNSGMTAQLTCGVHQDVGTGTWVYGDQGTLHMPDPWIPQSNRHALTTAYSITLHSDDTQWFKITTNMATYALEAELVAASLSDTQAEWPAMRWEDTLGNMRLLDEWRAQVSIGVLAVK